jgi:hypothetical protein
MQEGFDGLLRDKTPPVRIAPLGPDVAERVVALTQRDPPGEAAHWTGAMMAKAAGHKHQLRAADMARTGSSAILDNYAAHKHPKVRAWLAGALPSTSRRPRVRGSTPSRASLPNYPSDV